MLVTCDASSRVAAIANAQAQRRGGGTEANLNLPDLHQVSFLGVSDTHSSADCSSASWRRLRTLITSSCAISPSTSRCATSRSCLRPADLSRRGKIHRGPVGLHIALIMVVYFGALRHYEATRVIVIVSSASSESSAATGGVVRHRINTFANSARRSHHSGGKPFPTYSIPRAGHVDRHAADLHRAVIMLAICCSCRALRRPVLHQFAIGESLGRGTRIAGGIFTVPTSARI